MRLRIACLAALSCAAACTTETSGASYKVGGLVTGLTGTVTLLNNDKDALTVTGISPFTFATPIQTGSTYSVTVGTQPDNGICTVFNGRGTIAGRHITTVAVSCSSDDADTTGGTTGSGGTTGTTGGGTSTGGSSSGGSTGGAGGGSSGGTPTLHYGVGGRLTGLGSYPGSVTVANGTDTAQVSGDSNYVVSSLASGTAYDVTVTQTPPGWSCTVTNPNGTVGNANVTNVDIACSQLSYNVRGTLSGQSDDVTITDSGTQASVTAHLTDSTFTLPGYLHGDAYSLSITAPSGQICQVRHSSGLVCAGDVANVVITCGAPVSLSGAITGQSGSFVVAVNGVTAATVAQGDSSYQVANLVGSAAYSVTIGTQPAGQKCTVAHHAGQFASSAVTGVDIHCADAWTVSGNLPAVSEGLILSVTDGSDVQLFKLHGNPTQYSVPITKSNGAWGVSLYASPQDQVCTLSASGTNLTQNTLGANVSCTAASYTVSGNLRVAAGASGTMTVTDGTTSVSKSGNDAGWGLPGHAPGSTAHVTYTFTGFTACTQVPNQTDFVLDGADIAGVIIRCQ